MQVYNSLSRQLEELGTQELKTQDPQLKTVTMYVCGLTPYDSAHIGHTRTYVAFDIVKRYLTKKGLAVFHIQNITDVDDKIIKRCKETGEAPVTLVERNHSEALEYFDKLNIIRANVYPKVTEHIKEIIELIEKLIANGYAYETETGVYYYVSKFKNYGKLSNQKMDEIKAGSRKEVDETKQAAEDFALWKKTKNEIIEFDSPFGRGRPGWHIECSAMANKYAKKLDIHGGARDLIFPHHENEIAQSEAATGNKFCRYWLHTGFLTVNGEKMSKSLGNFITVKEVVSKFSANAIRLFFSQTHYRSPIDYNEESIQATEESMERIFNTLGLMKEVEKKGKLDKEFRKTTKEKLDGFYKHMENDFNTPDALAALFDLLRIINAHISTKQVDGKYVSELINELEKILWIFGLEEKKEKNIEEKFNEITELQGWVSDNLGIDWEKLADTAEGRLNQIVNFRDSLREQKKFKEADMIRAKLAEIGIILEDKEKGKRWRKARLFDRFV